MTALVIGEALIDVVAEPGRSAQRTPGGGPFNVAVGFARLQIPTSLPAHVRCPRAAAFVVAQAGVNPPTFDRMRAFNGDPERD